MANLLSGLRVWETTLDTSSPYDLEGVSTAIKGLQSFVDAGLAGESVFIMEAHQGLNEWQFSRATVTDAATDTYVIDQVIKSSNSDSQVSWSSGTRDVFCFDAHGYSDGPLHTITGATTLDSSHFLVLCNSSGAFQVDLPPVLEYTGKIYYIKNINTGAVTIAEDAGDSSTIEDLSGGVATSLALSSNAAWTVLRSDGTKWRRLGGNALTIATEVVSGTAGSVLFVDANGDLGQDNSNLYWDDSSNHLGVNTGSPGAALDVDGDAVFNESGNDVDFRIEGAGDENLFFVDASADYVGIGTNTPASLLHVATTSTSTPRGIVSSQHNTGTEGARFTMRKSRGTQASPLVVAAGDSLGRIVASGHDGTDYIEAAEIRVETDGTLATNRVPSRITFHTATDASPSVVTERARISRAGKFTIGSTGTPAPAVAFEVAHTGNQGGVFRTITATGYSDVRIYNNQNSGTRAVGLAYTGSSWSGTFVTDSPTGEQGAVGTTGNYPFSIYTNSISRFSITGAGVATFNEGGNDCDFRVEGSGEQNLLFCDAGNDRVGIGTSTPDALLHVSGVAKSAAGVIEIEAAANQDSVLRMFGDREWSLQVDGNASLGAADYFHIYDNTAASSRVAIDTSGNVGIGNTSPGAKLDCDGSAIFNESGADVDFRVEGSGEQNLLFCDAGNDRVGIGTASPAQALHVNGSATISSSLGVGLNSPAVGFHTQKLANWNEHRHDVYSSTTSRHSNFYFRKSNQNTVGNTATTDTTQFGSIVGQGNNGSGFVNGAFLEFAQSGAAGASFVPTRISFHTSDGTAQWAERVRITPAGNLLLGTTTAPTGTATEVLIFGDNAGDPTPGTNTAGVYAKDVSGTVEVFAIDEAANTTQLSPHDESGEWVFESKNTKTGRKLKVRMEELVKRLASKFPDEFAELIEETCPL